MKRVILAVITLVLPSLIWADGFGGSIFGGAATCSGADIFNQAPRIFPLFDSAKSTCTIPKIGTFTASALAGVDPLGITSEIEGQATTGGTKVGGIAAGAVAGAQATFFDTVDLISPIIDYTGGVTVIAGDAYDLSVSGSAKFHPASADITFSILSINGEPVPSPATYQQTVSQDANGSKSGNLSIEFTILACPCSFVWQATGLASSGGGSSASFHDPFFLDLPPGWTYTLASQQAVTTTPEPASLLLTGVGLLAVALLRRFGPISTARSGHGPERA